jgi:hypothetical protein
MIKLYRLAHRLVIGWQLRSLEEQAESIVEARRHALARLLDIQRDCVLKQELLQSYSRRSNPRAARW